MIPAIVDKREERWFVALVAGALACIWASMYFEMYVLSLVPFALVFLYMCSVNFRWVYFLLIIALPLSFEFHFSDSLGTDLPDEPLMLGTTLLTIGMVLIQARHINKSFLSHPIVLLLVLQFIWMALCIAFAVHTIVTLKIVLAKIWYLIPFVGLTSMLVQTEKQKRLWFWCLTTPLIFVVIYTLVRHALTGFSFDEANHVMEPFFRNHVNYAEMLAMVLPFIIAARYWYRHNKLLRRLCGIYIFLILMGILFSYTRLAWMSIPAGIVFAVSLHKRFLVWLYAAMMGGMLVFFLYMGYNNRYLYHSPEYETTIQHHDLDSHLAATYGVKDVSNAERLYRWIAGVRMWMDRPIAGYGPGNFYFEYKPYTVKSFRTYVSDNEERSTVHNYFLLTLIEQGIIGLAILLSLVTVVLVYAQRAYNALTDKFDKTFLLAATTCLAIILVNLLANDMIETDKVGSLYFMMIAFVINANLKIKNQPQGLVLSA